MINGKNYLTALFRGVVYTASPNTLYKSTSALDSATRKTILNVKSTSGATPP